MEFGKHIGKGLWGLAGRALPSVYGIGIIVFVIRVFPPVEFGVYTLLQTIFMLVVAMAQSFAFQPLVKYGAETDEHSGIVTSAAILYAAFVMPAGLLLLFSGPALGRLLQSDDAGALMFYVPLMLAASFPRNLASYLLQSKLRLRTLFLLDAVYSLGSLALISYMIPAGLIDTAEGVIRINLLTLALSSVYGMYILLKTHSVRPVFRKQDFMKIWGYGRYSLGASVSYTLYSQADNLIISAVMGPVSLAVYNAAKVFTRIFDLILQLINTLLVPVVSRLQSEKKSGELAAVVEKSFFFFSLLTVGITLTFLVFGSFVMDVIYGEKYAGAVPVLYILACTGIFIPGVAIGAAFCHGVARVKEIFTMNLLTACVGVLAIYLGTTWFGVTGSAFAVLGTFALIYPAWYYVLVRRAGAGVRIANILGRYRDAGDFLKRMARTAGR